MNGKSGLKTRRSSTACGHADMMTHPEAGRMIGDAGIRFRMIENNSDLDRSADSAPSFL
jgi:hypothetical protein